MANDGISFSISDKNLNSVNKIKIMHMGELLLFLICPSFLRLRLKVRR